MRIARGGDQIRSSKAGYTHHMVQVKSCDATQYKPKETKETNFCESRRIPRVPHKKLDPLQDINPAIWGRYKKVHIDLVGLCRSPLTEAMCKGPSGVSKSHRNSHKPAPTMYHNVSSSQ